MFNRIYNGLDPVMLINVIVGTMCHDVMSGFIDLRSDSAPMTIIYHNTVVLFNVIYMAIHGYTSRVTPLL